MKQRLQDVWEKIGARDLCIFGGLSILSLGAGMVYTPAAPIVIGVALLGIGLWGVPSWR